MGVLGEVATNSLGANMPTGHTSALARAGHTPYAVLEVDEHYLPQVIVATTPHAVALLNLSRDQLDRAKEVAMMAALWRDALAGTDIHVVANADDPMVVWAAAQLAPTVTWVASGQRWHDDSWVCPECGSHIERVPGDWFCTSCDLRRPTPQWTVDGEAVVDPDGVPLPGHPAAARPGQPGQRGDRAGGGGPVRGPPGRGGAAPGRGRLDRRPVRHRRTATAAPSGCCWPRTRPAGWRRSTWPSGRRPCCPSTPATRTASTRPGSTTSTSPRCTAGRCSSPATGRWTSRSGWRSTRSRSPTSRRSPGRCPTVPPGRLEVIANYTAFQDIRAELDRVN